MTALVAILILGQSAYDEHRLRDSWPKLVEAWHALESHVGTPSEEWREGLLVIGEVHAAFEAAGCFESEAAFEAAALSHFFSGRYWFSIKKASSRDLNEMIDDEAVKRILGFTVLKKGSSWRIAIAHGYESLLASLKRIQEMHEKKLDDEENVGDEMSVVRRSLKTIGVIADDTPIWLRRRMVQLIRALVLKETYPKPAEATEEQAKVIRGWIAELSSPEIEVREKATTALMRDGEIARPFLREALKGADPEVVSRAKSILGIGHAPWREVKEKAKREEEKNDEKGEDK